MKRFLNILITIVLLSAVWFAILYFLRPNRWDYQLVNLTQAVCFLFAMFGLVSIYPLASSYYFRSLRDFPGGREDAEYSPTTNVPEPAKPQHRVGTTRYLGKQRSLLPVLALFVLWPLFVFVNDKGPASADILTAPQDIVREYSDYESNVLLLSGAKNLLDLDSFTTSTSEYTVHIDRASGECYSISKFEEETVQIYYNNEYYFEKTDKGPDANVWLYNKRPDPIEECDLDNSVIDDLETARARALAIEEVNGAPAVKVTINTTDGSEYFWISRSAPHRIVKADSSASGSVYLSNFNGKPPFVAPTKKEAFLGE